MSGLLLLCICRPCYVPSPSSIFLRAHLIALELFPDYKIRATKPGLSGENLLI